MKAKRIWIIIIAVITATVISAYITPPHTVYPRYGQPTMTPTVQVRYVTPVPPQDDERDEPDEQPAGKPDQYDCDLFGNCEPGETPAPVATPDDFNPDCFYFGVCDEGEVAPTPVPATEPPGV